jgi:hypothetical protein
MYINLPLQHAERDRARRREGKRMRAGESSTEALLLSINSHCIIDPLTSCRRDDALLRSALFPPVPPVLHDCSLLDIHYLSSIVKPRALEGISKGGGERNRRGQHGFLPSIRIS